MKSKAKYEARILELEESLDEVTMKLKEAEARNRSREEDDFKKNNEFNKLNALIE